MNYLELVSIIEDGLDSYISREDELKLLLCASIRESNFSSVNVKSEFHELYKKSLTKINHGY